MIDFVGEHWNNALTLFLAAVIGYYQIQNYRAKQADIKILDINEATYGIRGRNRIGELTVVDDPENEDVLTGTHYSLTALTENDGREPATISEAVLLLPDTNEELALNNRRTKLGWQQSHIKFDGNDRKELDFFTSGEVRGGFHEDVEGVLRIDTTAGVVEESVTFESLH